MKKLTRKAAAEILDVMFASPTNEPNGTASMDLADALDMIDVKLGRPTRAFYRAMQQLIDERRVVQTEATPYAHWKAVRKERDPIVTDVRGRRRGMLSQADYITQVQVGLGRALSKSERRDVLRSRLEHIVPSLVVRALSPAELQIVAETIDNGEDSTFVVTIDIEEAASEAVVVRAITRSVAMSKTLAWLKSIDFDNLDGVKLTVREYEHVHIIR